MKRPQVVSRPASHPSSLTNGHSVADFCFRRRNKQKSVIAYETKDLCTVGVRVPVYVPGSSFAVPCHRHQGTNQGRSPEVQ